MLTPCAQQSHAWIQALPALRRIGATANGPPRAHTALGSQPRLTCNPFGRVWLGHATTIRQHGRALHPQHEQLQNDHYTWPGSNWRPSACEADVIATRPQVLLPLVALAPRTGETNILGSRPWFCLTSQSSPRRQGLTQAASCGLIPLIICQQLYTISAKTRHPVSRACGVVVSHPLRMRKALGSIPSRSNCPNHSSLPYATPRGDAKFAGTRPLPIAFAM